MRAMPNYRLLIEYEGTRYSGWQEQRNARTVAGELKAAAGRASGAPVALGGAGRTDAGVHALGQVAHLRTREAVDPLRFRRDVNDLLPPDIHVAALVPAADGFHARHDAVLRSYVYQVAVRRTVFARKYAWWVKRALDVKRMQEAVPCLAGRHDFARLAEQGPDDRGTLVELVSADVVLDGGLILVRLAASHFLWKMVRRIVGVLVRVGAGEWPVDTLAALLEGRVPRQGTVAEATAPPTGLFLERVLYPGDPPLGAPVAPAPVAAEPRGSSRRGIR